MPSDVWEQIAAQMAPALVRWPTAQQPNPLIEDRRGAQPASEEEALRQQAISAARTREERVEIARFIDDTLWPENWEPTGSEFVEKRLNPDGSYDYRPLDEPGPGWMTGDAPDQLKRQGDDLRTPLIRRQGGRW